jgi:hypothetical protein
VEIPNADFPSKHNPEAFKATITTYMIPAVRRAVWRATLTSVLVVLVVYGGLWYFDIFSIFRPNQ